MLSTADAERGNPVVGCDLDGVIWRGDDAIPGAAAGIATLRAAARSSNKVIETSLVAGLLLPKAGRGMLPGCYDTVLFCCR